MEKKDDLLCQTPAWVPGFFRKCEECDGETSLKRMFGNSNPFVCMIF